MIRIDDLVKKTGLTKTYINKCLRDMKDTLEPFIFKGSHNANLFDNNAEVIFDHIKQYKAKGLSLPEIKKRLSSVTNNFKKHSSKIADPAQAERDELIEEISRLRETIYQQDKDILELRHKNERREAEIRLLPAGGNSLIYAKLVDTVATLEAAAIEKEKGIINTLSLGSKVKKQKAEWTRLKRLLRGEDV